MSTLSSTSTGQKEPSPQPSSSNVTSNISQGITNIKSKVKEVSEKVQQSFKKAINVENDDEEEDEDAPNSSSDRKTDQKLQAKIVYNEGTIKRRTKRVLVTGGCGFIGSHLVDELMKHDYDVICIDNLFSGDKNNISKHFGKLNFEFIRHDVTQPLFLEVDEIYHLACPASPVFYQDNPIKTLKTCFLGTSNMLGLAKRTNARILLTSTSEVYGDPRVHPQTEEYWGHVNPIGIRSCYDEGKRIAETLMFEYHRKHNVNIAVARIFNTYGPRMLENDGRVVSNFIVQALKGESLTIYGDGSQTRSFCYIDDQVRGLMSLMESKQVGPINIGNPEEYTIKQLAENVTNLVNKKFPNRPKVDYSFKPLPSDDPTKRKPDITKARNLLKWEPKIGLEQGLTNTINYFAQYVEINNNLNTTSGDNNKNNTTSSDNSNTNADNNN